jgi:oxygen-independent coproporphyrinogen-3 oxidase
LEKIAKEIGKRFITSIYFGGGTPSLLPAKFIGDLLNCIHTHWDVSDDCEISMEMNPGNATEQHIANVRAAGINRISLGVQALTEHGLAILGRKHSVDDALRTVNSCSKFFQNYSVDLIYAWPTHTLESWKKELAEALALGSPHISCYQLVVEDDSVFGHMYSRGELLIPSDETCANMFDYLQETAAKAGLPAYEISNHARPGFECRHNVSYWKYTDYVGIGPGAHSRITINGQKYALAQEINPQKWLDAIIDDQHMLEEATALSSEDQSKEAILVGLRMTQGIVCEELPLPLEQIVQPLAFDRLIKEKYLNHKNGTLIATPKGRKRLNALIAYLIN